MRLRSFNRICWASMIAMSVVFFWILAYGGAAPIALFILAIAWPMWFFCQRRFIRDLRNDGWN